MNQQVIGRTLIIKMTGKVLMIQGVQMTGIFQFKAKRRVSFRFCHRSQPVLCNKVRVQFMEKSRHGFSKMTFFRSSGNDVEFRPVFRKYTGQYQLLAQRRQCFTYAGMHFLKYTVAKPGKTGN